MVHPVYNQGVYAQLQVVGLGKLKPNVIFMGYSGLWHRNKVNKVWKKVFYLFKGERKRDTVAHIQKLTE